MWKTLRDTLSIDGDLPARAQKQMALLAVLNGTLYDGLKHPAHCEYDDANRYIKLRDRRPSVRYNLCKLAVIESVSMLFSEGHFPAIEHENEATRDTLQALVKDIALNETMLEAGFRGSVGSVALWMRVLQGRPYVDVLPTTFLTPTWNPQRPDALIKVTERYKVRGSALRDMGYDIDDDDVNQTFWFQREWDDNEETWFLPVKVDDEKEAKAAGKKPPAPRRDRKRSVKHGLGFVPLVWIRNLPGGDAIDGCASFDNEAIETQIELEYQMTQAARGLRYSQDPLLMIKEPAGAEPGNQMVRSASNAIVVDAEGDAKLLEITGGATEAVINYVNKLRDMIKEGLHASRVDPERMAAAQSGRAMEILNQPLVWLADKLRVSYGMQGLQALLDMLVKVGASSQLMSRDDVAYPRLVVGPVTLKWPEWYPPSLAELQTKANTLRVHTDAGHMSRETAVGIVAKDYDTPDPAAELVKIKADQAELAALAPQVKEQINA